MSDQDDLKERLQLIAELSGKLTSSEVASIAEQAADRIVALEAKLAEKDALIEHAGGDGVTGGDRSAAIEALNAAERQRSFGGNGTVLSQVRDIFARHRATAFAAGKAAREREIVAWLRALAAEYKRLRLTFQAADCNSIAGAIERGEV